jgi:hypothetical protein
MRVFRAPLLVCAEENSILPGFAQNDFVAREKPIKLDFASKDAKLRGI